MPQATTKQLHIRDFTLAEMNGFIAAAHDVVALDCCVLIPGEGRAQQATIQRAQAKMQEVKVGNMTALPAADQPSGLHVSFPVDKQMLDDWLRPQIKDLPEIGKYVVVQPPRNPDVALRVRWEDDSDSSSVAKGKPL